MSRPCWCWSFPRRLFKSWASRLENLLDESAPRLIKTRLPNLSVHTVQEMSWTGMRNGELLAVAESRFDVFITADRKLRYQQNLTGRRLAVLVLPSNQVPVVAALLPAIERALTAIQPGTFVKIPQSPTRGA